MKPEIVYRAAESLESVARGPYRECPFVVSPQADAYAEWHRQESICRLDTDQLTDRWINDYHTPIIRGVAGYFFVQRCDVASDFLQDLVLEDGSLVFDFHEVSTSELLTRLLGPWWNTHGRRIAFFDWLQQHEA